MLSKFSEILLNLCKDYLNDDQQAAAAFFRVETTLGKNILQCCLQALYKDLLKQK